MIVSLAVEPRGTDPVTTCYHRSLPMLGCALVVGATAATRSRGEAPDPSQATSLTVAEATVRAKTDGILSLPRLATQTPDVAGILARHDYDLRWDGLAAIPPAVAAALRREGSGHVTRLILPPPPDTPVDTLRELARADFNLEFSGPVTIATDVADAFARYEKVLTFSGTVAPLAADVARRLVCPGMLKISGPIVLSDEVARILGERRGCPWALRRCRPNSPQCSHGTVGASGSTASRRSSPPPPEPSR